MAHAVEERVARALAQTMVAEAQKAVAPIQRQVRGLAGVSDRLDRLEGKRPPSPGTRPRATSPASVRRYRDRELLYRFKNGIRTAARARAHAEAMAHASADPLSVASWYRRANAIAKLQRDFIGKLQEAGSDFLGKSLDSGGVAISPSTSAFGMPSHPSTPEQREWARLWQAYFDTFNGGGSEAEMAAAWNAILAAMNQSVAPDPTHQGESVAKPERLKGPEPPTTNPDEVERALAAAVDAFRQYRGSR